MEFRPGHLTAYGRPHQLGSTCCARARAERESFGALVVEYQPLCLRLSHVMFYVFNRLAQPRRRAYPETKLFLVSIEFGLIEAATQDPNSGLTELRTTRHRKHAAVAVLVVERRDLGELIPCPGIQIKQTLSLALFQPADRLVDRIGAWVVLEPH